MVPWSWGTHLPIFATNVIEINLHFTRAPRGTESLLNSQEI